MYHPLVVGLRLPGEMLSLDPNSPKSPLCVRPELDDLAALMEYVEAFGKQRDWAAADVMAFSMAAEELFANTLRHSQPAAGSVRFSISTDGASAAAEYSDNGGEFDPTGFPEADTSLPVKQRPIGGLGIYFIRKTMPTFTYARENGWNVVRFGRPLAVPTRVQADTA